MFKKVGPHRASYLIDFVDKVHLINTKFFDCKHLISIFLIDEFPNITGSSGCKWPLARFAELEGKYIGSRKDPIQTACPT